MANKYLNAINQHEKFKDKIIIKLVLDYPSSLISVFHPLDLIVTGITVT